jgi:hypothetical protein
LTLLPPLPDVTEGVMIAFYALLLNFEVLLTYLLVLVLDARGRPDEDPIPTKFYRVTRLTVLL